MEQFISQNIDFTAGQILRAVLNAFCAVEGEPSRTSAEAEYRHHFFEELGLTKAEILDALADLLAEIYPRPRDFISGITWRALEKKKDADLHAQLARDLCIMDIIEQDPPSPPTPSPDTENKCRDRARRIEEVGR